MQAVGETRCKTGGQGGVKANSVAC